MDETEQFDDVPPGEGPGEDQPESLDPFVRKVKIFDHWVDSGRWDRALEAGNEALADAPENGYLHSRMGYIYYRLDRIKEATQHLQSAMAADPDDAYPRSLLALCNASSVISKFSKVEREAFNALRLDPDDYNAWLTLAESTIHYDEPFSLSCCDRLIQLAPEHPHGYITKSNCICSMDQPDHMRAQQMIESALILSPDADYVHCSAAYFFLERVSDKKRGIHHLETALQINPSNEGALEMQTELAVKKDWIVRILSLPWTVARGMFSFFGKWADQSTIFMFTWMFALALAVVALWITVCWLITFYPVKKLYEWLILRAEELRWSTRDWLAPIFRLPSLVRLTIWMVTSSIYLIGMAWLFMNRELEVAKNIYTWIGMIVVFGFIPLGLGYLVWEWWVRRRLNKLKQHIGPR